MNIIIFTEGTEIRSHRPMSGVCYRGRSTMYLVHCYLGPFAWHRNITIASQNDDQIKEISPQSIGSPVCLARLDQPGYTQQTLAAQKC